jgi:hypothetical protein
MNDLPADIPPGLRYGGGVVLARAHSSHGLVRTARADRKGRGPTGAEVRLATATSPAASGRRRGYHLIGSAMAEPIPVHRGGKWFVPAAAGGKKQTIATEHSSHQPAAAGCGKPSKGHACQSVASAGH